MGDSSEELSSESSCIPYSERPEWADVQPLEQNDGPDAVVRIAYSNKFKDVYGYFRAIFVSKEISQRALDLTADALDLNPANYTVWHHRRHLLKELGSDLEAELDYCREIIEQHPKNYQVWLHRQVLVEWTQNPARELRLTEIVLSQDAKNYHAWQHRQWVMKTFKLFDQELEYVERLLEEDIRNNSAWNQRFFVISHLHEKLEGSPLDQELKFTMTAIEKVPGNESSWNYLCGLMEKCEDDVKIETRQKVREFCNNLLQSLKDEKPPIYLLATLVDVNKADNFDTNNTVQLCEDLASQHDVIRKEYWSYMKRSIQMSMAA